MPQYPRRFLCRAFTPETLRRAVGQAAFGVWEKEEIKRNWEFPALWQRLGTASLSTLEILHSFLGHETVALDLFTTVGFFLYLLSEFALPSITQGEIKQGSSFLF